MIDTKRLSFGSNKTFLVVRNPYDVILSLTQFLQTLSHSGKTGIDYKRDIPEWWHSWCKIVIEKMRWYFDLILTTFIQERSNPLYIIRYEDILLNKKETLMGLFSFILG